MAPRLFRRDKDKDKRKDKDKDEDRDEGDKEEDKPDEDAAVVIEAGEVVGVRTRARARARTRSCAGNADMRRSTCVRRGARERSGGLRQRRRTTTMTRRWKDGSPSSATRAWAPACGSSASSRSRTAASDTPRSPGPTPPQTRPPPPRAGHRLRPQKRRRLMPRARGEDPQTRALAHARPHSDTPLGFIALDQALAIVPNEHRAVLTTPKPKPGTCFDILTAGQTHHFMAEVRRR